MNLFSDVKGIDSLSTLSTLETKLTLMMLRILDVCFFLSPTCNLNIFSHPSPALLISASIYTLYLSFNPLPSRLFLLPFHPQLPYIPQSSSCLIVFIVLTTLLPPYFPRPPPPLTSLPLPSPSTPTMSTSSFSQSSPPLTSVFTLEIQRV